MEDMRVTEEMKKVQSQSEKLNQQIKIFNLVTPSDIIHKFLIEKLLKLGFNQIKKNMTNLKNRQLLYAAVYKKASSKEKQHSPIIKSIEQKDFSQNNKKPEQQQKIFDFDDRCSTIQKQSETFGRKSRLQIDEFFNPRKSIDFDQEVSNNSIFNLSSKIQSEASQVQRTRRICGPRKEQGIIKLVSKQKEGNSQKCIFIIQKGKKASIDVKITVNYIQLHPSQIQNSKIIDVKSLSKQQSTCRSTSQNTSRTTKKKVRSINQNKVCGVCCSSKQNKLLVRQSKSQYI